MPTLQELADAEAKVSAPLHPYDLSTGFHEREVAAAPAPDGTPQVRMVSVRVVQTFGEALGNANVDYWHKGGTLTSPDGKEYGTHPAGWFIKGYKWVEDRPRKLQE